MSYATTKNHKCNVCGEWADTEYEKPYLCMECAVLKYEGRV